MKQYLDLLSDILENGHRKNDRTGTGTMSVFGRQMRFNLQEGFPLVTTKKCHLRSIIHELLWFLQGDTNIKYLNDNNVTIWDEWADENGNLGPVYGKQWREWSDVKILSDGLEYHVPSHEALIAKGYVDLGDLLSQDGVIRGRVFQKKHDQISSVMEQLRTNPDSRRIIVSAWNVGDLSDMALEPCHSFFQFYSRKLTLDERLSWTEKNDKALWDDYTHATYVDIDKRLQWLDKADVPTRLLSCQLYQRKHHCAFVA